MRVISKEEFQFNLDRRVFTLHEGVFIHPTDTIYGLGCNAEDDDSVKKLRELKERNDAAPFSVIAPSKDWVRKNCFVNDAAEEWLGKLPGPHTLILQLKNMDSVSRYVNPGITTLGVRIPNHWFAGVVAEQGFPVVTTSANKKNCDVMTSLEDLDSDIKKSVNFIVFEGDLIGSPSQIVDLVGSEHKILRK